MNELDNFRIEEIISHLEAYGYLVYSDREEEEIITELENRGYEVSKPYFSKAHNSRNATTDNP